MKKGFAYVLLLSLVFIVGCSSALEYEDHEVAAVVRGEEITIGDLRFLYPDKGLLDKVEGTAMARLVVQEAKRLNIEPSEEEKEQLNTDESIGYKENRAFADKQAIKLGMEPEEYYKEYQAIANEMALYVTAYINEMVGEPPVDAEGNIDVGKFNEQANQLLDELFLTYEDEIEIRIK